MESKKSRGVRQIGQQEGNGASNHTVGPWMVREKRPTEVFTFGEDGCGIRYLASIDTTAGMDRARADALLVSAAPDLFDAGEKAEVALSDWIALENIPADEWPEPYIALVAVRDALTKAGRVQHEDLDHAEIQRTLIAAGIDTDAARDRLLSRVSEFEKMRAELAGARELIEKLQESIDHLTKQVVPDSLPTPTGRVMTIAREHANNCACGDLENCRACRMRDLFTLIPISEDEEIAAYVESPDVRRKRREEIAALVQRIRAGLAKVAKPRPVPICGVCGGPLFLDGDDKPHCPNHGPVVP